MTRTAAHGSQQASEMAGKAGARCPSSNNWDQAYSNVVSICSLQSLGSDGGNGTAKRLCSLLTSERKSTHLLAR